MKRTLHDLIVLRLAQEPGAWVMGFDLEKVQTEHGWIGNSGQRRARELAEAGYHNIGNVEYTVESRKMGKYVQYRVRGTKDLKKYFIEANGMRGWTDAEKKQQVFDKYPDAVVLAYKD